MMVEVIWPLSAPAYSTESCSGKGVLPLRTFIQETLRRSRTSFSTLQVAMYYLILIKAHVPKCDFTMEQPMDTPSLRALQCGRRMFLAALILASKYLQDRNYSARAWSKISGLKVCEINTNEIAFLQAVDWQLHVEAKKFERWQMIVMSHTPPLQASGLYHAWKAVIPLLTPELDTIEVASRSSPFRELQKRPVEDVEPLSPMSYGSPTESTPTPLTCRPPRFLEPKPDMLPPTPCLARMGPLPTPQLTPRSSAASTPAASLAAWGSRRPSMCAAMAQAQNAAMNRSALDQFAVGKLSSLEAYSMSRRPSLATSVSSLSSPESMVSDNSSIRSSRASSVSSVSSKASMPFASTKLAKVVALRCAGFPDVHPIKEREMLHASSDPLSPDLESFHINDDKPLTPPRTVSPMSTWNAVLADKARRAARFEAAREQLAQERDSDMECQTPSPCKGSIGRKRGRSSVDLTLLQSVREQLHESSAFGVVVAEDPHVAKSFLFETPNSLNLSTPGSDIATPVNCSKKVRTASGRDRPSCSTQARRTTIRLEGGPGMWNGIL